jgi:hypothetical protein
MIPGLGVLQGAMAIGGSLIGGRARRQEQQAAKGELANRMNAYENMDFKNPYANMENTMEDLTVNTQQADFMAQQQQQGMANTMGAMQGAAGGSGIAALAQAMSNQQNQNLQQSSASIGLQESQNQMASARMAGANQLQEMAGAGQVQDKEQTRTETLLGMAQTRMGAANQARSDATSQLVNGLGSVAGGVMGGLAGMETNGGASDTFFQSLLGNPSQEPAK